MDLNYYIRTMKKLDIAIDIAKQAEKKVVHQTLTKLYEALKQEYINGTTELISIVDIPVVYEPDETDAIMSNYFNNQKLINGILGNN